MGAQAKIRSQGMFLHRVAFFFAILLATPFVSANQTKGNWSTKLHVHLTNDYESFSIDSCPEEAFANLRVELFAWIQDELLSIFGTYGNLSEFQYTHDPNDVLGRQVPLEAVYDCKACGKKQWSSDSSIHNVAFLLQWFTQLVRNRPRSGFFLTFSFRPLITGSKRIRICSKDAWTTKSM